jgi:hypothetical protein
MGPGRQRERERRGIPVQGRLDGPRAGFKVGPKSFPEAFSYFLLFFLFSFFGFPYFFYRFCKDASNQNKPLSEIF